ncbi:MAG TPA: phospholipase D-like domain-containing protein [Pseudonocardia sp.]|jgi:phosphatidylserine/phosphatidylglycerophosphate/cardiolipin synthase-like enzyme|nr:phospholipase D-like domain-containing protein [Pseudonocardia sp.]
MDSDRQNVADVLLAHSNELNKPGVLSVRPGYEVSNGWFTGRPAIVATVARKLAAPPAGQALPDMIDNIPVDVRQASARKRQSLEDPAGYAETHRLAPNHGAVPQFADEHTFTDQGALVRVPAAQPEATLPKKPNLPYTPAPNTPLTPVQATITLQLSASPDNGWPTLRTFLTGVASELTVGLYDFTSKHILDTVTSALAGKQLRLVLDHPAKNPTADQTDETTVADLRQALGTDLDQAWALTRTDKLAAAWIYPSAYHIKVAVRDHQSVWLSSGNWNNSNQPDIDPVTDPSDAAAARRGDRDWHVVIDDPELAATFEAYLNHDLSVAAQHQNPSPAPGPALQPPDPATTQTPPFTQFFPPKTVTASMTITPLLTPDPGDYAGAVAQLIASATTSLYLQFQYIEPPRTPTADSQPFSALIQAVADRQRAGVDIKIIMSEFETSGYLEQLKDLGINVDQNVKIQDNVHNKGIVVDGATVLVSSQNWSTAGTLQNRDAGVIIANADAAQYFQQLFLHDWQHLAEQKTTDD